MRRLKIEPIWGGGWWVREDAWPRWAILFGNEDPMPGEFVMQLEAENIESISGHIVDGPLADISTILIINSARGKDICACYIFWKECNTLKQPSLAIASGWCIKRNGAVRVLSG